MKIELIEIDKITPYINNPRKNQNIDKVASSIKEFGFQQPIVVDKKMTIIVGHTRYEASKKLELKNTKNITDIQFLQEGDMEKDSIIWRSREALRMREE